jgi:peptidoglycan LD-endopeptidase LytH
MMTKNAKAFLRGAACGLAAGVLLATAVVWQVGPGGFSTGRGDDHPAPAPSALERWTDGGPGNAAQGVVRGREVESAAVGTSGNGTPVVVPAPSPEPILEAPPAAELGDRDLMIPVQGVSADQLTPSYAHQRGSRQHEAIDILAPRHTPVLAVEDGTIARLFYSQAGGITIYQFDPSGRFCYYYAHLERYADDLAEGQQVQKGQVLGYVGVSGNAPEDTPHLHFAIFRLSAAKRWWEGTPIDPFEVLGGTAVPTP